MDITNLTAAIPVQISFVSTMKYLGIFAAVIVACGLLLRIILGRHSPLNRAICAGIGVLCVYVLTIIVYTFSPGSLERFLTPLPFISFSGNVLQITAFSDASFSVICAEIVSVFILVLLYNLTDNMLPDGESTASWFLLRTLTIVIAMAVHYLVSHATGTFLPDLLVSYGPMILLICLVISLLAGLLGALLGLVMVAVNPVLGLLVHFFFSSGLGKHISRAMLTTALLTVLVITLNHFGYCLISISAAALLSYIPLLLILVVLWWMLERIF